MHHYSGVTWWRPSNVILCSSGRGRRKRATRRERQLYFVLRSERPSPRSPQSTTHSGPYLFCHRVPGHRSSPTIRTWNLQLRDIMVRAAIVGRDSVSCSCSIILIILDLTCLAMTKGSIAPCHGVPGPWTNNSCSQNSAYRHR